jgi:hypothetical protein
MDNIENIPTWDNGVWTVTSFKSKEDFKTFVFSIFKEPGQYNFNQDAATIFIEQVTKV